MSYNTTYELTVKDAETTAHELGIEDFIGYNPFENDCTWYEHVEQMQEYSKNHPDTLFELRGIGEENLDFWVKYFKNGKMQECRAKFTFDAFDESKLE